MSKMRERGHGAQEAHAVEIEIVEKFFRLHEDARLGILRTIYPRAIASLPAEKRAAFLRQMDEDLRRAQHGQRPYDVRPGL